MISNNIRLIFKSKNHFSSCCESANSPTKDACCHVDGIKKHPPIWVPDDDGPVEVTTITPLVTTPVGECGKSRHLRIDDHT